MFSVGTERPLKWINIKKKGQCESQQKLVQWPLIMVKIKATDIIIYKALCFYHKEINLQIHAKM